MVTLFKRRRGAMHPDHLREMVAPRKGWDRGLRYVYARIRRLPGSPHRIALGVALGVFVSFTPLFGLHMVLAALLAWLLSGNLVAAMLGTLSGNPLTFPLIAPLCIRLGNLLLGTRVSETAGDDITSEELVRRFPQLFEDVLLPYLAGGVPLGIIAAAGCYLAARPIIAAYQMARRKRRMRRAAAQPSEAAGS